MSPFFERFVKILYTIIPEKAIVKFRSVLTIRYYSDILFSMNKVYDCIIVGGGVIGCLCARELKRYSGDFLLLERGNDVAVGTSKANSGIVHAGYDALPGTLKAKYNVLGARLMQQKCRELDVPYKINGALVVAFDGGEALNELKARGDKNGAVTEIISGDEARALEPRLSGKITRALRAPTSAIVSPYELTVAAYENFLHNGGNVRFNSAVTKITRDGKLYKVFVGERCYTARAVINAAGLYSDTLNNMVCKAKATIVPRRGQYMLLDKTALAVNHTAFQTPTALGKGVLVAPTCHGNTLVGPNAEDIDDKDDTATTAAGLDDIWDRALLSVPTLSKRDIITQFSGNRAAVGDDFIIGESEEGFFNALGVSSPGLASSPAIGEYLAKAVAERLHLDENKAFDGTRRGIPRFAELSDNERNELIKKDPAYGRIICRCETVTEGEIVEAIKRGAVDLDGIKRRVRAGMGRCQAGFCTPNLIKILCRELNIPPMRVTKRGGDSTIIR